MRVRLEGDEPDVILGSKMADGDLAVIVRWDGGINKETVGCLIQRYKDTVVLLGRPYGSSYTTALGNSCSLYVRLLKPGDKIVVD